MVRVTIKLQNDPHKAYGRINGFRVSDVSEDPTDTAYIVCILSLNGFQIPYSQSKYLAITRYSRLPSQWTSYDGIGTVGYRD